MTENREKAIKRTKNLAYWFMGEMLKEEERGEKEKEAFEKAKEAGELVVMISTAENNARVMKSCMKEYEDCSIRDIADHYIEGIPEISQREVHRDEAPASDPGKIRGENTEDKAVNEGTVRYDIMFRAILPQGQETIKKVQKNQRS